MERDIKRVKKDVEEAKLTMEDIIAKFPFAIIPVEVITDVILPFYTFVCYPNEGFKPVDQHFRLHRLSNIDIIYYFPRVEIYNSTIKIDVFKPYDVKSWFGLDYRTKHIVLKKVSLSNYNYTKSLHRMKCLKTLKFEGCAIILNKGELELKFNFPPKLESFYFIYIDFYIKEGYVGTLVHNVKLTILNKTPLLRTFVIFNAHVGKIIGLGIGKIIGLGIHINLTNLVMHTYAQTDYTFLSKLINLKYLEIENSELIDFRPIKNVNYLQLEKFSTIRFDNTLGLILTKFGSIPKVKKFTVSWSNPDHDLSILHGFENLNTLDLTLLDTTEDWRYGYLEIKTLEDLEITLKGERVFDNINFLKYSNIKVLKIIGNIKTLKGLNALQKLSNLEIHSDIFDTSIPIEKNVLVELLISAIMWKNLKSLIECKQLEVLSTIGEITSIDGINELTKLRILNIYNDMDYTRLVPSVINLPNLKSITMEGFLIKDMNFISSSKNIKIIRLEYNTIESMRGIEKLKNLEDLMMDYTKLKSYKSEFKEIFKNRDWRILREGRLIIYKKIIIYRQWKNLRDEKLIIYKRK